MKSNQNIMVEGKRVRLVPYREIHVAKYHEWMQDADLRLSTASELLSLEEEFEMQKSWASDEDKCTFIVVSREKFEQGASELDAMIGDVNMFFTQSHQCAELNLMVAEKSFQNKGLGQEILVLMLLYGVKNCGTKIFQAKIGNTNEASIRLFEKLGFRKVEENEAFGELVYELTITEPISHPVLVDAETAFKIKPYY